MNQAPAEGFQLKLQVPSDMVGEIGDELAAAGATDVDLPKPKAALDPITLTVVAVLGFTAAGDLIMRIRAKRQCRQIIDARGEEVKTKLDCDVKDGRIIVIAKDGDKVEIADVPDGVDLGEVIKAARTGGAAAVKKAAGV